MELTDAQLAALLRQTDEAWVESTNIEQPVPNIDAVLDATDDLVAEVRSLRARIAEADYLHRPCEWHLFATRDCPYEECDSGDQEHRSSGGCITATYKVCAECVDNWWEGMVDWLDVTEDVPPDDTLWPCPTHTALHASEENTHE